MRLIDADKFQKDQFERCDNSIPYIGTCSCDNVPLWSELEKAPTVEAVPVVHGHWMWFEEISPSNTDHYEEIEDCGWKCSCCNSTLEEIVGGYWDDIDDAPKLNYCPNCGAKMNGEREEND